MTIEQDVQKLEPGNLLEFFTVDNTEAGGGILRFHKHLDGTITWQGEDFAPWPIDAEGFELTSNQQPAPTITVANIDGSISLLCMLFEDMVGATVTRSRTFKQYLDAVNFPGGVNPTADPTQEFPPEIWKIERKVEETQEAVKFELASPLDFGKVNLPRRQIIANQCNFVYRGEYCNYTGDPVATALDVPTTDPDLDRCSHKLSGCLLREWPDEILNFGGFVAAGLVRT